ncbi:hypothetical protein LF95_04300 [Thalassospira sp. TSL5-1]|nr:hypothetical protein LF95_04300 [Thalassospira sp. TSL5-1]
MIKPKSPFNRKATRVTPETLHCFDNNAKNIRGATKSYIKKCFLLDLFKMALKALRTCSFYAISGNNYSYELHITPKSIVHYSLNDKTPDHTGDRQLH